MPLARKHPFDGVAPSFWVDWRAMPRSEVPPGSLMLTVLLRTVAVNDGARPESGVDTNNDSAIPLTGSLCVLIVFPWIRTFDGA